VEVVALDVALEPIDLVEHAVGAVVVELAGLGQLRHPRRSLQELHAEPLLEPRDQLAGGGLRGPERGRRARERAGSHDGDQHGHPVDRFPVLRERARHIQWERYVVRRSHAHPKNFTRLYDMSPGLVT